MTDSRPPSVSVVICTYNRARDLANALVALTGLDYPSLEVVVVNGPSTDDTERLLSDWAGRIKVGRCDQANLSMSRNVGISLAAGEIIAFLDDDAAPHPQWIARLAEGFRDPEVGAVGGFTIDNTGTRWQVRKTVCDRYGNAFNVSDLFDERPLCQPGAPYFPSLLGTNSAFRATALREIGGFDQTFAYLLDETDVCLRLVDAGWRINYEPRAMVYHRFAPSHIRSGDRIARTLFPSAVSKAYFVMRHGAAQSIGEAASELERYRNEILQSNDWLNRHGRVTDEHRFSLDQDLIDGIKKGVELARINLRSDGDLAPSQPPPFIGLEPRSGFRIAFVTQSFTPQVEAGIARWSALAAESLVKLGHHVHVITRTDGDETIEVQNGVWLHRLKPGSDGAMAVREAFDIPPNIADWAARVWREVQHLKSFGLDIVSFPIWDLEGISVLDDPDLTVVVSLHTTYAMAKPFKPEWNLRPLFEHQVINRVIAAERSVLARAPTLLANSQAVIQAIEDIYELEVTERCHLVPHGTLDPLKTRAQRASERERRMNAGEPLRILYVGRFEYRKGSDIAIKVAAKLIKMAPGIEIWFAGGRAATDLLAHLDASDVERPGEDAGVRFLGELSRDELDDAYVDCDLVLIPSRFESFGLVGVEALAAGRPVFALSGSGLSEVIEDGMSGCLWPDTDDVADRIANEILRLNGDRISLRNMGRTARETFERRFTVEAMGEGLQQAYRNALGADRHRESA